MYKMNDLLIGLDLSAMDDILLEYTARIATYLEPEKIYLMHVAKKIELPEDIVNEYPDLVKPLGQTIKEEVNKHAKRYFSEVLQDKCELIIEEGNVENRMIDVVKEKDVELVLLGRKTELKGKGIKSHKLAKLLPCTIAFIPEVLPNVLNKILVPTDFSDPAKLALEFAGLLSGIHENASITCFHAYHVPQGYHSTGKSYEEFADIMRENAKRRYHVHVNPLDHKDIIQCEFQLCEHGDEGEDIYGHAIRERYDAIVMGSKGRTGAASLLLGSTAEKLLDFNKQVPIFIVKDKSKNMGFIEALLSL